MLNCLKSYFLPIWLVGILLLQPEGVLAQYNPSSAVLLRSNSQPPEKNQLDSGRYTIKQAEPIRLPVASPPPTPPPAKLESKFKKEPNVEPQSVPTSVEISPPQPEEKKEVQESVVSQVKHMVLGGTENDIQALREKLAAEDRRNNLVELTVAPAYVYTDSSSNYWYRDYYLSSPALMLGAQVWLSPYFGVNVEMINSLNSSLPESSSSSNKIKVDQQWLSGGLRWRKYWGVGKKMSSLSFSVDYVDYRLKVPSSVTNRNQTKTTGVRFSLEGSMFYSPTDSFQMGVAIEPRAQHSELSAGAAVKSGQTNKSSVVSFWVGNEKGFDRSTRIFWRIEEIIERNLFEGTATGADPETGATPTGVSVNQATTMFTFGVRWGH